MVGTCPRAPRIPPNALACWRGPRWWRTVQVLQSVVVQTAHLRKNRSRHADYAFEAWRATLSKRGGPIACTTSRSTAVLGRRAVRIASHGARAPSARRRSGDGQRLKPRPGPPSPSLCRGTPAEKNGRPSYPTSSGDPLGQPRRTCARLRRRDLQHGRRDAHELRRLGLRGEDLGALRRRLQRPARVLQSLDLEELGVTCMENTPGDDGPGGCAIPGLSIEDSWGTPGRVPVLQCQGVCVLGGQIFMAPLEHGRGQ